MKLSTKMILGPVLFSTVALMAGAYQVGQEGTRSNTYKDVIEKTVQKPTAPVVSSVPETIPNDPGPTEYWFHPKIHSFGNTGWLGGLHASMAPIATFMIDTLAYRGENIRVTIARDLRRIVNKEGARVLDMCCGVGISTRALLKSFKDAEKILAIDTSPEMISMAEFCDEVKPLGNKIAHVFTRALHGWKNEEQKCEGPLSFKIGNAEYTGVKDNSFDLVTIMYGFHEVPYLGRQRILREAARVLRVGGTLAVVDICPSYSPSATMLSGEPYVLEYQTHIQDQLRSAEGFYFSSYNEVVEGHVGVWLLKKKTGAAVSGVPFM